MSEFDLPAEAPMTAVLKNWGRKPLVRVDIPADPSALLTPGEAASLLGVRVSTLQVWRNRRVGPAYIRLNHSSLRYRRSDIEAWIEARKMATIEPGAWGVI